MELELELELELRELRELQELKLRSSFLSLFFLILFLFPF